MEIPSFHLDIWIFVLRGKAEHDDMFVVMVFEEFFELGEGGDCVDFAWLESFGRSRGC